MAKFVKIRGVWGIRIKGFPQPGSRVSVQKRDGSTKTVTCGDFVRRSGGWGYFLIDGDKRASKRYSATTARRSYSAYCGYPCPVSGRRCCAANGPCHDCS